MVICVVICGFVLFLALPHGLAALEHWCFLRCLRRAFESGILQPRWPSEAVMYPCEIREMCEVWVNSVEFGNDGINLVSCYWSMQSQRLICHALESAIDRGFYDC